MTPRERLEAVLRGGRPDRVPFTVYEDKLPRGRAERELRNEGLCLVQLHPQVYTAVSPNVKTERVRYSEKGVSYVQTNVKTPVGDLYSVERLAPNGQTSWYMNRLFKSRDDYKALEFMIRDREFLPNYAAVEAAQALLGDDGLVRPSIGFSPMQELMVSLMGLEAYAAEWAERRDEVMRLYDALTESRRKVYPIAASSPALAVNYCGNVSAEVVGLPRFEKYYVPHYNEFAEVMHAHGKVMGVHFDANTWALCEAIEASLIDYVEALTPWPDSDLGIAEARTAWSEKILWINFPPSVHVQGPQRVEETMRQILWEAAPGDRFVVGITEDVPPDRWQESFEAMLKVINREAGLPIQWKSPRREAHLDVTGTHSERSEA